MRIAKKTFSFEEAKDQVRFLEMLTDPDVFRPARTTSQKRLDGTTLDTVTKLTFTPSFLNLLLTDRSELWPKLTYAQVKRKVQDALDDSPFYHVREAELVKMCMQNFSNLAVVA